jgi:hypothetical protein
MTHPTIAEALAPFRPLTYTEHYYIDLGYRYERGKAEEYEYKRAQAEGPEARRLLDRGASEAFKWSY